MPEGQGLVLLQISALFIHTLFAQVCPEEQLPQLPPHPSSPHCFPEHEGTQGSAQCGPKVVTQTCPDGQIPLLGQTPLD